MTNRLPIPHFPLTLSPLALGAAAFGTGLPDALPDRLYQTFRAAGGTTFDTAHCYCFWLPAGAGASERTLGETIRRHGDAGKVQVITKGGHPACLPKYPRPDAYLSPELLARDIAESLDRLGLPIDLYFLHRDDARVPVGEILGSLNEHIAAGRIKALGASNWSVRRLAEANAWAAAHHMHGFVASQPEFNLAHRNAAVPTGDPAMRWLTAEDLAWHEQTGLPVVCYSPTAGGYFASNATKGREAYENPVSRSRLERAQKLAGQLGVTVAQLALAWVMNQRFPVVPILGTRDETHLREALGAAAVKLTAEQVAWVRG